MIAVLDMNRTCRGEHEDKKHDKELTKRGSAMLPTLVQSLMPQRSHWQSVRYPEFSGWITK
jgi:hypothetical protein